jgi:hypothetical protein
MAAMNEHLLSKAGEEIDKELRGITREEPITEPHFGIPSWTEGVMNKAVTFADFGDDVDDVTEAVQSISRFARPSWICWLNREKPSVPH